jgi:hypothetical protein
MAFSYGFLNNLPIYSSTGPRLVSPPFSGNPSGPLLITQGTNSPFLTLFSPQAQAAEEERVQNSFLELQKRFEFEVKQQEKNASSSPEDKSFGIFGPNQGYDRSAVGSWNESNQGYVSQSFTGLLA